MKKIPSFVCSPWDFYKTFLKLSPCLSLVLCDNETEVRTMRVFGITPSDSDMDFPILEIKHPNFVDIHETYVFRNDIFVIHEYVGFSIADLIRQCIYPTEHEIAYIISQVSPRLPSNHRVSILMLQILSGIQFIWSMKLPHPRISSQNILLSPKCEVKIGKMSV